MNSNSGRRRTEATVDSEARTGRLQWRWERGQAAVAVALTLVVLVAFVAIVIDLGNVYSQRRLMQNAADAGALAGARLLALEHPLEEIDAAVREYTMVRNGASSYGVSVVSATVGVTVSKSFSTYLAAVIGVDEMTVWASAAADYSFPLSWEGGLMPLCIDQDVVDAGRVATQPIQIWDDPAVLSDPVAGIWANGHRGWLNFNGGDVGDDELKIWAATGYGGLITPPMDINGSPGMKTATLKVMADLWEGKLVYFPVYDSFTLSDHTLGSGQYDYHITAFAAFKVTDVVDTAHPKYIAGYFVETVVVQERGGPIDNGVRVIGLVQ